MKETKDRLNFTLLRMAGASESEAEKEIVKAMEMKRVMEKSVREIVDISLKYNSGMFFENDPLQDVKAVLDATLYLYLTMVALYLVEKEVLK